MFLVLVVLLMFLVLVVSLLLLVLLEGLPVAVAGIVGVAEIVAVVTIVMLLVLMALFTMVMFFILLFALWMPSSCSHLSFFDVPLFALVAHLVLFIFCFVVIVFVETSATTILRP